jgi:nitrogen-specific signal transduction histidine kinase
MSKLFLDDSLESIDSGVITLDSQQHVVTANPAARALLDCVTEIGAPVPAILADYAATGARGYVQRTIGERVIGFHGAPLAGAPGESAGTVLVLDDLTERRALEEQIQRAQRLAALGRLAGGLAHEIRNPLGITRASAQMLQRELEANILLRDYTQVIQTEIDRARRGLQR